MGRGGRGVEVEVGELGRSRGGWVERKVWERVVIWVVAVIVVVVIPTPFLFLEVDILQGRRFPRRKRSEHRCCMLASVVQVV